jgi:hypothetical protein
MVFDHAPHVKVLNCDHAEPANQIGRYLVEEIFSGIGNPGMEPGHFKPLPGPAPAVFLAPAQDPGGTPQLAQGFIQGFEGLNLFACAQGGQRF